MKITKLESKDNKMKFILDKSTFGFANELRRAIMFDVPTLAIEDVYFVDNSSALYDEMIALRLGLIPLKTDLKTYKLPEDCTCKGQGCARCEVKFTIRVKGPRMVYAKDLQSTDAGIHPVYPDMPIVELIENQELELEAVAKLGHGLEHTKWSPALAFYHKHPKKIDASKLKNYDVQMEASKDTGEDDKFIFTVESWGQLSPEDIVKEALKLIQNKLTQVKVK